MQTSIIEYDPNYIAISDGAVEEHYEEFLSNIKDGSHSYILVGNESFINRVRLGIALGELLHTDVEFRYNGVAYHANTYGQLHPWPQGFCEFNITMSQKILDALMKRYEKEQKRQ